MNSSPPHTLTYFNAAQYFLYFGVMGVSLPFFNLYCYHIGFSGMEIGVLSGLRSAVMVVFPLVWAGLADRYTIRKPIYALCNVVSTVIWAGFLFTADFTLMVVIMAFYSAFHAPIISFLEAFTMDALGAEKKSYGKVRAWGSISFIATVILLGAVLDFYPIEIIIYLILIGSAVTAVFSFFMPTIRVDKRPSFTDLGGFLAKRRVLVFLFCAFLMLVSHGAYYAFLSIHLETLGLGKTFIGIAWAVASTAEILVMINSKRIFSRFSAENVLFFSFIVASARWATLSFITNPTAILCSQILHAVTYGSFHIASIIYIDHLTPEKNKTMGQAVNNAITYGFGLMVGFFLNGYLYEHMSCFQMFAVSAAIAGAGGLVFKVHQLRGSEF
ncbi:MAG: MFS transporter [Desulfobacterales bacterium]|nr:MFS transporter [Desulfobacterales bacterium]